MEFYLSMETLEKEIKTIQFKNLETDLGEKWSLLLKKAIDNKHGFSEPDRIYGLNEDWSKQIIVDKLNETISNINDFEILISQGHIDVLTQKLCNELHDKVVDVRSGKLPEDIKMLLADANTLIHRHEGFDTIAKRLVVILDNSEYTKLEDDHLDSFTLKTNPNDVMLNYCHKGKSIVEMFWSKDEIVGANIIPQHNYCANFQMDFRFGMGHYERRMHQFEQWWIEKESYLANLGHFKNDPKCALGKGVVGKIIGDVNVLKDELFGVQYFKEIGYV